MVIPYAGRPHPSTEDEACLGASDLGLYLVGDTRIEPVSATPGDLRRIPYDLRRLVTYVNIH